MTLAVMREFGVFVVEEEWRRFRIAHGQRYRGRTYAVEADASSAHYFFAAAAITGGTVRVEGLRRTSLQGDIRFLDVLERLGAAVREGPGWVEVEGPERLNGIDVDMNEISDTALTLAAIAPLAAAPVRIRGVSHIRHQESDRIAAVTAELRKLGARVRQHPDGWEIEPSAVRGAVVDTYGDHRIAMAFSVLGLRIPDVAIRDPACVRKTFPDFYDRLEELRR
jgi:3-phosphoshikimate 1-carboxyvinyltransferase